jgi:hypothetical protein
MGFLRSLFLNAENVVGTITLFGTEKHLLRGSVQGFALLRRPLPSREIDIGAVQRKCGRLSAVAQ